jgi:general secretion pathway protein D
MLCFVMTVLSPPSARAEFRPPTPPSVLVSAMAADMGPNTTRITLGFATQAPKYVLVDDGTGRPGIALTLTSRASTASLAGGRTKLLRAVDFDQQDNILLIRFTTGVRTTITASLSDQSIVIDLSPATKPAAADQAVAAARVPVVVRDPSQDEFEVVPLRYADVSEVVGLLTDGATVKSNDAFTPQEPAFGSAGINGSAAAPAPLPSLEANTDPLAQSVDDSIAVDRRLNAIILKGSADRIARLKAKIAQIDVPVRSVLLETVFVELDQSGAQNVGLDFNNTANQIAVATMQVGGYNTLDPTGKRVLTSAALQGAIYAQVTAGHGRIVSKPRIAAQSGSTAKIITGDALPILTAITLSGVNGVSQQVQYVNVGVTLQIAPRVSDDGFVTSHVFCVVSSVTGTSQGYPTISQREASTSATVRDGETFVIGGLSEESYLASTEKVPILGDLPAVGELLKHRTGNHAKTELYIVVTPHIIRQGDGAADIPPLPPER